MTSSKLVLLGFLRHTLGAIGVWLVARGYLTPEQQMSWTATAVQEAFGALMLGGAYLWSYIDKQKVLGWLLKALHLPINTDPATAAAQIAPKSLAA